VTAQKQRHKVEIAVRIVVVFILAGQIRRQAAPLHQGILRVGNLGALRRFADYTGVSAVAAPHRGFSSWESPGTGCRLRGRVLCCAV